MDSGHVLHWCYDNDTNYAVISKRKSEIRGAVLKIQLHKSQLIHMIATKFQRLHQCFRDQAIYIWTKGNTVPCLGMLEIKDGGH